MSWEHSITFAFIGSALVVAYIASCIKEIDDSIHWTRFLPLGLRTCLYFVSLGLLLFAIGVQTPIMMVNEIWVNESTADSTVLMQNSIVGGVGLMTKVFYVLLVIIFIIFFVLLIEKMLLKKKPPGYDGGGGGDYDEY